jgi:2-polyprenyl-3-methyl-5-hydroxy-6-metoxy-1,4-benzoquinol methylase
MNNRQNEFNNIYSRNLWGKNLSSGVGSSLEITKVYRKFLVNFINEKKIKTILSIGIGDCVVMEAVMKECKDVKLLIGLDISKVIIEKNIEKFKNDKRYKFRVEDIVTTKNKVRDKVDLIVVKEVLLHLTDQEVLKAIFNIQQIPHNFTLYTSHMSKENTKLYNRKDGRLLNLFLEPFNFQNGIKEIEWTQNLKSIIFDNQQKNF